MGFMDPKLGNNDVFGAGSTWPSSVRPGDEVWAYVCGIDTPATAFTAPTGWTQIGSTTNWTTSNAALFKHTYAAGDTFPAANTWKGTFNVYVHSFVIKSTGTYAIQTDTVQTGVTNASLQGTIKKFSPADAANDLRILLVALQGSYTVSAANPPAVTASDNNPTGLKLESCGGIGSSATAIEAMFRGWWADPSGLDANDGIYTFTNGASGKNYFLRSICLTDGTGSGGLNGDDTPLSQAQVLVGVDSMSDVASGLDAAKGRYVGRAKIL